MAVPVPATAEPAVAVSVTVWSAWAVGPLELRLRLWIAAAGLSELSGMLGGTVGLSAGAPRLELWSLHAAGVPKVVTLGSAGHAVWPSGIVAEPGVTLSAMP